MEHITNPLSTRRERCVKNVATLEPVFLRRMRQPIYLNFKLEGRDLFTSEFKDFFLEFRFAHNLLQLYDLKKSVTVMIGELVYQCFYIVYMFLEVSRIIACVTF